MQEQHYKTILYFISAAILGTLAIQGYWNYKNFEAGKQQLINDVQLSIDNAVNKYYATKTQERFREFTFVDELKDADSIVNRFRSNDFLKNLKTRDSFSAKKDTVAEIEIFIDSNDDGNLTSRILRKHRTKNADTIFNFLKLNDSVSDDFFNLENKNDSLFKHPLAQLTSSVLYSMAAKKVDLKSIDSLLVKEFELKKIDVAYSLYLQNPFGDDQKTGKIPDKRDFLSTVSTSAFLPKHGFLKINFSNITETVLKRNIIGLLFSLLFVIAIISCLLYLLKIIKNQKQLAEVKNDLISNITHEFKTPIATIGAAMEGIQNFNTTNDAEKNLRYAKISSEQVQKLNGMVEKLLETATLDSENLELNKESKNLVILLKNATTKETFVTNKKSIFFNTSETELIYPIDVFHFENAINNIIDNAIKYGGSEIEVTLLRQSKEIEIIIKDSGDSLTETQKKQIFEKFYRVPKGNTHDVKGFGIGLYYSKAIIEKHEGSIHVTVKPTTFKITLPHG
ncbi:two-component sensor histidine kinase [Patiriisocius marinistellae]|uniref:histidine kinase n=1 Tax=Patiriisocius marinistellae TaxID=2494560 RepID=A0A5J4FW58_9FLAO|nr:HAMP domain-containing sensor histidine kinase [Patiriisocius marinistellae]GEQ85488.1 two-component sensor histidine kinase [Patiriisocius marinistellae]